MVFCAFEQTNGQKSDKSDISESGRVCVGTHWGADVGLVWATPAGVQVILETR